jgi:hypothetical protein
MGIFAHAIRLPRHAARILRFHQVLLWKRSFHSKKARQQKGADAPKCSELTRHLIRQAACKVSLKLYDPLRYGVLSSDDRYSRCVYSITRSRRMEVLWENFTVCSQSTLPCRHGESFAAPGDPRFYYESFAAPSMERRLRKRQARKKRLTAGRISDRPSAFFVKYTARRRNRGRLCPP